jgi:predicted ribosomally synthesized peptide with SipW-like signal peptide
MNASQFVRSHKQAVGIALGLVVVLVALVTIASFNSQKEAGRIRAQSEIACMQENLASRSRTTVDCQP